MLVLRASVYFDKKKNVLIFPLWSDEDGITRLSKKLKNLCLFGGLVWLIGRGLSVIMGSELCMSEREVCR